jgi:hypothetical protein
VKTINGDIAVKVLPNPNKGSFTLKGSLGTLNADEVSIEVTNMLGQTVYNGKAKPQHGVINAHVDMGNNVPAGMYLLNLRAGDEQAVFHIVVAQ